MPLAGETALRSSDVGHRERFWLGGLLAISVALQLVGTVVRYATFAAMPSPAGSGLLPTPAYSYSLYQGMHWGRAAFFLTLATTSTLAYLGTRHRDRWYAALVSGFCAYNLATVTFLTYLWSENRGWSLGPGFYFIVASAATAAFIAVWAVLFLRPFSHPAAGLGWSRLVLAVGATVAVGLSTVILDLRVPFGPLVIFDPLSLRSGTAAAIGFVAVAAFPLVALRVGGRIGSCVLLGLAFGEAIRVLDAALRRFGNFRHLPRSAHLTIGWWIEMLAVVLLVTLARELRSRVADEQAVIANSEAPLLADLRSHNRPRAGILCAWNVALPKVSERYEGNSGSHDVAAHRCGVQRVS